MRHAPCALANLGFRSPNRDITRDALAETALRFLISEPAVYTVIPGIRSVRNVERNAAVADGRGLPRDGPSGAARPPLGAGNFYR